MHNSKISRRTMTLLLLSSALTFPMTTRAKANEPVTVAVVTAGGVVGAAALTAIGALAAATVTAIAVIASSDSEPAPSDDGGGDAQGQSAEGDSLFVDADGDPDTIEMPSGKPVWGPWILSRGGTITIGPARSPMGPSVEMKLAFDFHGDIAAAPKEVSKYVYTQTVDLEISAVRNKESDRNVVPISLDSVRMSTTDEAGTNGYNYLTIESRSGGERFRWRAGVEQGKRAQHDRLLGGQQIETGKDMLRISKPVVIPFPVDFKGRDEGKFQVRITFEGSGSRV
mgnify:CR=1 FL=1